MKIHCGLGQEAIVRFQARGGQVIWFPGELVSFDKPTPIEVLVKCRSCGAQWLEEVAE